MARKKPTFEPAPGEPAAPSLPPEAAQALVAALPFPVLSADPHGFLVGGNPAARRLLGCTWGPWGEERAVDYYADPGDARRVREGLLEAEPGRGRTFDVDVRSVAGERIPARLHGVAVRDRDGDVVSTVALVEDLRSEIALQRNLETATRQSIEAERRSGQQAQGRKLAHELNQPLTVAMGVLEMLASGPDLPEPIARRLGKVQEQLDRIANTVRRFREESRPRED